MLLIMAFRVKLYNVDPGYLHPITHEATLIPIDIDPEKLWNQRFIFRQF